jgi:hypothetical protein
VSAGARIDGGAALRGVLGDVRDDTVGVEFDVVIDDVRFVECG